MAASLSGCLGGGMTDEGLMSRYLWRLGLTSRPQPSWETLRDLVARHLESIPFENLDVVNGLRPDLSTTGVLHKVIVRRRGGFCYELNEAFHTLLRFLGFQVRRIEARVWSVPQQRFGAPFDHLALVVALPEGEFLTDVGFGDGNRVPLSLPESRQEDVSGRYTLSRAAEHLWLLTREDRHLYEMTLDAQPLEAFVSMYRHHQTSPDSIFTQGLICTRATPDGRITLSAEHLTAIAGAQRTRIRSVDRDGELQQYFGIEKEEPC